MVDKSPHQAGFGDLAGASVFLTGGGSGIGAALTLGFLACGAKVAFAQNVDGSVFCDEAEATYGVRPLFIDCDITAIGSLERAIGMAEDAHGPLDVLLNNAANDQRHDADAVTEEFWDWSLDVNLKAHFFAAQMAARSMKIRGKGAIINVTSISYMMGNTGYPAYVAAKSAMNGLTRSLAREWGTHGIRVNALVPGWVMTDRQKALWATEDAVEKHIEKQCLKRQLQPEDMVGPALFLASDASAGMAGQALVIDAGVVTTG